MIQPFVPLMLGDYFNQGQETNNQQNIEYRKKTSQLYGKTRKDSKLSHCYYCNREVTRFCNSHSLPAFVLRNIASEGIVYNSNKLIGIPLIDEGKGVSQSGTFQIICRNCDSQIFSDYENPSNYEGYPTNKMIAQIALKNHLKNISKRRFEIPLYENMKDLPAYRHMNQIPLFTAESFEQRQKINNLDLKEFDEEFKKSKKALEQDWSKEYFVFFYRKLDYVVPLAAQTTITLPVDFEGKVINDIFNYSSDYKIQSIHVCVFPLQTESVILMFIDSKYTRLKSFYRYFKKLTLDDQLATINFMLFVYSEDIFISKHIDEEVLQDPNLIVASQQTQEFLSLIEDIDVQTVEEGVINFSHRSEIPNLLSVRYKITPSSRTEATS